MSLDKEIIDPSASAASSGDDAVYFKEAQAKSREAECYVLTSGHHHDSAGRFHMAERIPRASRPTESFIFDASGTVSPHQARGDDGMIQHAWRDLICTASGQNSSLKEGLRSVMSDEFWTLSNWSKIRTQFSAEPKGHTGGRMPTLCPSCQLSKVQVSRLHSSRRFVSEPVATSQTLLSRPRPV